MAYLTPFSIPELTTCFVIVIYKNDAIKADDLTCFLEV